MLVYICKVHSIERSIANASQGIVINNIEKDMLSNLPFPLPPLAEQHRIVTKVDELLRMCDLLEVAMNTNKKYEIQQLKSALWAV